MNTNETVTSANPVGLWTTVGSVLTGMCGIQSSRARERDFTRGNPVLFVAVALTLTATFALTLMFVVRAIAAHAAT